MVTDQQVIDLVRRADPVPDPERLPEPRYGSLALLEGPGEHPTSSILLFDEPASQASMGRRWLRPATAFGAALLITLGTIGVIALAGGEGPQGPADSSAPTTSIEEPAVETTVADTLTEAPGTLAPPATTEPPQMTLLDGVWTGAALEFRMTHVEATGIGLVATGAGSIWTSSDGTSWNEVFRGPFEPFETPPPDPELGLPPGVTSTSLGPVVEYNSAVYVFGHVTTLTYPEGSQQLDRVWRSYVWRSHDGAVWEQIPLPLSSQMHSGVDGAVALDDRLLAWVSGSRNRPILFLSEDGANWAAVEHKDSGLGGDGIAIVVAHDGEFLAVVPTSGAEEMRHQIYTSATGESWEPGYEFGPDAFPTYSAAVTDDALFLSGVAFGQVEAFVQHPGLWRTGDGRSFDQVELPDEAYASWGFATNVIATPRGLLLVAWHSNNDGQSGRLALFAGDSTSALQAVDDPDGLFADAAYPTDVAFLDDRVVIVGEQAGAAFSWVWSPDS